MVRGMRAPGVVVAEVVGWWLGRVARKAILAGVSEAPLARVVERGHLERGLVAVRRGLRFGRLVVGVGVRVGVGVGSAGALAVLVGVVGLAVGVGCARGQGVVVGRPELTLAGA